jgi:hypothetical protein
MNVPSPVTSAGTFPNGLSAAMSLFGAQTSQAASSIRPDSPSSAATTRTLRANGEAGEYRNRSRGPTESFTMSVDMPQYTTL